MVYIHNKIAGLATCIAVLANACSAAGGLEVVWKQFNYNTNVVIELRSIMNPLLLGPVPPRRTEPNTTRR